nr:TPA_asm: hypothetical protein HUJ06_011941 [Nelumbo nucifera]
MQVLVADLQFPRDQVTIIQTQTNSYCCERLLKVIILLEQLVQIGQTRRTPFLSLKSTFSGENGGTRCSFSVKAICLPHCNLHSIKWHCQHRRHGMISIPFLSEELQIFNFLCMSHGIFCIQSPCFMAGSTD